MKPFVIHEEAEAELSDSVVWYNRQRQGLGLEFQSAVEHAISTIQQNPTSFTQTDVPNVRKYLVKRFPFTIFYEEGEDFVVIFAIAHQKRKPGYWAGRISD